MDWLFGKVGLDGHVQRNRLRIGVLFAGFLVAAFLVCLPAAALASLFIDFRSSVVLQPVQFLTKFTPIVGISASAFFLLRWLRFPVTVEARLAAVDSTPACRRIQRLVREIAILNGRPEPRALMIQSAALNAFAAGLSQRNATIIVTTGLEEALTDAELKAVLAHEMAHIALGDTQVMAASAVMVDSIEAMRRFAGWRNGLGWKTALLGILSPLFIVLGSVVSGISAIADTIGRGSRLIVAASREMIADAEAIRITHDPAALVSALQKIDGRSGIGTFPRAIEAMMIDGPASGADATHPTISERIQAIVGLTGAHFPIAAGATLSGTGQVPQPGRMRSLAALFFRAWAKPAKPNFAERAFANSAFGRVRAGQGRLVKNSLGFKIVCGLWVALLAWGMWIAPLSENKRQAVEQTPVTDPEKLLRAVIDTHNEIYGPQGGVFHYGANGRVYPPEAKARSVGASSAVDSRHRAGEGGLPPLRGTMPLTSD